MERDHRVKRAWRAAARWVLPAHRGTLPGGVLLGGLLVTALALAGVVGLDPLDDRRPGSTASGRPLTATQPELRRGLLGGRDLPAGYQPAGTGAGGAAVGAVPSGGTAGAGPAAVGTGRVPPTAGAPEAGEDGGSDTEGLPVSAAEGCARLFAAPWEVAAAGQPLVLGPELADHVDPARAVRLRQALGGFTGDGAAGAMAALRRATEACPRFAARLDDGTEVTVALDPATDGTSGGGPDTGGRGPGGVNGAPGGGGGQEAGAPAGGGPLAGDDAAYAVRFTAHAADGRTWTGYLAADRVGPVVSVLRHLGPAGTVDAGEMAATRDAAVAKARPLAALLGRETAGP